MGCDDVSDAQWASMTGPPEEVNDYLTDRVHRLEETLRWIRLTAGLHYLGQAFDPEHMRAIANLAADALEGVKPELADFAESMEAVKVEGKRMAKWLGELADEP